MFDDYCINLPYPCVCGEVSEKELDLLYELSVGRFSKMTALTTYLYQSLIFSSRQGVNQLLSGIFYCELSHLINLLRAIVNLGGDPVLAGKHNYFSGSYANYQKDLESALSDDVYQKEQLIEQFERLISQTQNQSLCELLNRIVMDEKLHVKLIKQALLELVNECQPI